jgi:hypothetical protein
MGMEAMGRGLVVLRDLLQRFKSWYTIEEIVKELKNWKIDVLVKVMGMDWEDEVGESL